MGEAWIPVLNWTGVFVFGAISGMAKEAVSDGEKKIKELLWIALVSGCFSFAVVAILLPDSYAGGVVGHGLAALCGLSGHEVREKLIDSTLGRFLSGGKDK